MDKRCHVGHHSKPWWASDAIMGVIQSHDAWEEPQQAVCPNNVLQEINPTSPTRELYCQAMKNTKVQCLFDNKDVDSYNGCPAPPFTIKRKARLQLQPIFIHILEAIKNTRRTNLYFLKIISIEYHQCYGVIKRLCCQEKRSCLKGMD